MDRKILIVEDENSLRNALVIKLKQLGYDISIAEDGEKAVEVCRTVKPDLVILDLMMPKLDGFGFMESVAKDEFQPKIIVLSNLNSEDDISRAKDLGAIDYFVKSSIAIKYLVMKINESLEDVE